MTTILEKTKLLVSLFSRDEISVATATVTIAISFSQLLCIGKTSYEYYLSPYPHAIYFLLTTSGRLLIFFVCIMGITLPTAQVYKTRHAQQELKIVIVLPSPFSTHLCSLKAESVLFIFALLIVSSTWYNKQQARNKYFFRETSVAPRNSDTDEKDNTTRENLKCYLKDTNVLCNLKRMSNYD